MLWFKVTVTVLMGIGLIARIAHVGQPSPANIKADITSCLIALFILIGMWVWV